MAMSVRETIGYGSEQEVTLEPLAKKEFRAKIKQLNELPIEVIQKLISPRIIDMVVSNGSTQADRCTEDVKDCTTINAKFRIMFAYDIIGFPYSQGQRFYVNGKKWVDYSNGIYPKAQFFGRKAGFMVSEINYVHHLKGHKSTYTPFQYANHRSPFAFHTPHRDGTDKYTNGQLTKELIDILFDFKAENEPTIENHDKFIKDLAYVRIHTHHSMTSNRMCRYLGSEHNEKTSRLECSSPHNEDQYCNKYCKKIEILRQFETHPHLFYSSSSFCFGNNLSSNLSFQDAQQNRNPITFIKALIYSCSYITENDSRGGFEFFSDVFLNSKYLWDNKLMRLLDKLKQNIHSIGASEELIEGVIPIDNDHQISLECYCLACLSIRGAIVFGLKIDTDKLVQDRQPYCNADQMQKLIKEFERGSLKRYDTHIIELFNGNSEETVLKKHKFTKISQVLAFLVDLDLNEIDFKIKLSPIDFRNRIVSSGTQNNHTLFIDFNSGKLIVPSTIESDKRRVQEIESYIKILNKDYKDLLPNVIKGSKTTTKNFLTRLAKVKIDKNVTTSMYEPYQLGLTTKEAKKVNSIIKKFPDKSNDSRY